MTKEIQKGTLKHNSIRAIYGMGSFFHRDAFNDLDLVAVVDCDSDDLAKESEAIRQAFSELGQKLGFIIDLTIFTPTEFAENPLRDMPTLVEVFRRQ